MLKKH